MKVKIGSAIITLMATAASAQTTKPDDKPVVPGAVPSPAPAVKAATAAPPPAYTPVRWNEDYSYLNDPAKRADFFDPIKYIRLGRDDVYLSLGGQFRERYEYFGNNAFGAGPQDDDGFCTA